MQKMHAHLLHITPSTIGLGKVLVSCQRLPTNAFGSWSINRHCNMANSGIVDRTSNNHSVNVSAPKCACRSTVLFVCYCEGFFQSLWYCLAAVRISLAVTLPPYCSVCLVRMDESVN